MYLLLPRIFHRHKVISVVSTHIISWGCSVRSLKQRNVPKSRYIKEDTHNDCRSQIALFDVTCNSKHIEGKLYSRESRSKASDEFHKRTDTGSFHPLLSNMSSLADSQTHCSSQHDELRQLISSIRAVIKNSYVSQMIFLSMCGKQTYLLCYFCTNSMFSQQLHLLFYICCLKFGTS